MVRTISKIRSTGRIIATQAGFSPTELNTTINITMPAPGIAADPMLAKVVVSTTVNCCPKVRSTQCIWAKKTTAMAW